MQKVVALIFTSIFLSSSKKELIARKWQYRAGLESILRNLPEDSLKMIIDNTGFFSRNSNEFTLFPGGNRDFYLLSYSNNEGRSNKGIGELEMLNAASEYLDFDDYDKIIYMTGRYIYTQPYSIENAIRSNANLVYCTPSFYGLDGKSRNQEDCETINDMFFCADAKFIKGYLDYFRSNKDRMIKQGLPSEKLLWEYHNKMKLDSEFRSIEIPAIGIVRATTPRRITLDEVQII